MRNWAIDQDNIRSRNYSLFLGGEQVDTVAVWNFYQDRFERRYMYDGFVLVPDVNGDTYDDWIINYSVENQLGQPSREGYFLYFGSDTPDATPDSILEAFHNLDDLQGEVAGGDVNGDGFGDVLVCDKAGYSGSGELQIFFGSRWMSSEASVIVNGEVAYPETYQFGESIGALGDYNGDDVIDFAIIALGGGFPRRPISLFILAGDPNWVVEVEGEEPAPMPVQVSLSIHPNPFNDRLFINYTVSEPSFIRLGVYDINGRLVESFSDGKVNSGQYSVDWRAPSSGVFLVVLSTNVGLQSASKVIQKVVCLK